MAIKYGYGTKSWAKWALHNLEFSLMLLEEPYKQWTKETTQLAAAVESLGVLKTELQNETTRPVLRD